MADEGEGTFQAAQFRGRTRTVTADVRSLHIHLRITSHPTQSLGLVIIGRSPVLRPRQSPSSNRLCAFVVTRLRRPKDS